MDAKAKLLESVKKNINLKGLVEDVVVGIGHEALVEAAKKSPTPIDDMVVATLAPKLEEELLAAVNKKLDELLG